IIAAGILLTSDPMPISATIRPEVATEASSSRALNATTGRIAPLLTPYSTEGPNAGTAIFLKLKGASRFDTVTMRGEMRQGRYSSRHGLPAGRLQAIFKAWRL